jgi:hypothetical protein
VTCVIPSHGLRLTTLFGPSAVNHHPTPITVLITSLHQRGRSWPLLLSSYRAVKQSLVHELVNVKLIILSDAGGALGKIRAKVDARGGVGGLRCHASGLHPQYVH